MSLEERVGYHLMIGVRGPRVTPTMIRQFQKTHAVGLIVFRPNFESATRFKKLLTDLEKALGRKLLVAVDHEGGRVIHLAEGLTVFPDNWMLGNTGKESYARKQGEIEARELRRLGIDLNLAPTLDVLTETFSPNIGIRSYGKNHSLVARFGAERIKAMQTGGLSACAKHFPGLGTSSLDPHLDLPTLGMTWKELRGIHLKPFQEAIRVGVDCVMSSHPVYPKLDALKVPATFSEKIIRNFLREELCFPGVILSDDLEMGALRGLCPIGESAVRAVAAGHDMVLLCHDEKAQGEAYRSLLEAYKKGRLNPKNLEASTERIQKLISKRPTRFVGGIPKAEKKGEKVARKIAKEGIRSTSLRSPSLHDGALTVIFPKISELADKFYIENEMLNEKQFVKKVFSENGMRVSNILLVSIRAGAEELQKVKKICKGGDSVVFFCYDAHLAPGNKAILDFFTKRKNASVVLLRDPYDEEYIKEKIPFVTAYGFRSVQIRAAVQSLAKR